MTNKSDIRWLLAGATIGLIAAAYGVLRQATVHEALPDNAVARVNDTFIGRDIYGRALGRVATPDSVVTKNAILTRLVEDELLVQRGVELGMPESDAEVRAAIVNSLVASVTAEADAADPQDDVLQQYLVKNADRYSYTARLSVDVWQTDMEPVAQAFVNAIRSGDAPPMDDDIRPMPGLPEGPVATEALRNFLGPAITAAAAEMPDGSSAVFARRGRWLVVRVDDKERDMLTELEPIRNRVLLDYRRGLAERMLNDYIDGLSQRADIVVVQP